MPTPYAINLLTDTFNRANATIGPSSSAPYGSALYNDPDSVWAISSNTMKATGSNGGINSLGHLLQWVNYGSNAMLNQEILIDIADITPFITASNSAALTIGLRVNDGGNTGYFGQVSKSDTSHIYFTSIIYQQNTRPSQQQNAVAVTANNPYRIWMQAYWDEVKRQSYVYTSFWDISVAGGGTGVGSAYGAGTSLRVYGGYDNTIAQGYATHKTNYSVPGCLCPADGNCGLYIMGNPSGGNGIVLNQIVINDPVGFDVRTGNQSAPYDRARLYTFPGMFAGNTRSWDVSTTLAGVSGDRFASRGEYFLPNDASHIQIGIAGLALKDASGSANGPNRKIKNAVTYTCSIEVPTFMTFAPQGQGAASDQLTDKGQLVPMWSRQNKASITVLPGSEDWWNVSLPARLPAGTRVFWNIQATVPPFGEVPGGLGTAGRFGDDPGGIATISALTLPTMVVGGSYSGSGSLTGTVYVAGTVYNDPYGESQPVTAQAFACGSSAISGSGGNVTYSTSYTGNGTIGTLTDTTSNQFANLAIGSQLTVSAHTYTIIANNGSGTITISTNWASLPGAGTAYTIQCDTLQVQMSNPDGCQAIKWYAGTSSGNSNLFPLTDTNGVDPLQPYIFSNVATTGSNPPTSGTIYPDITRAYVAPANWVNPPTKWVCPTWISCDQPQPAISIVVAGTSIEDSGGYDFGTTAGGTPHIAYCNASGGWPDRAFKCITYTQTNSGSTVTYTSTSMTDTSKTWANLNISVGAILIVSGAQQTVTGVSGSTLSVAAWSSGSTPAAGSGYTVSSIRNAGQSLVNLGRSGGRLVSDFSDYYGRSDALFSLICQHTNVAIISEFTNDNVPLAHMQARMLQRIAVAKAAGNQVWVCDAPPRCTASYLLFTSVADQTFSNPGVVPGNKLTQWNTWLYGLVTQGVITGVLPVFASIMDASGKWGVVGVGSTIIDPVTYQPTTWSSTGTSNLTGTGVTYGSTSVTDSSQSWATNQFYNNGVYVVVSTSSGNPTAATITANTATGLTMSGGWTHGTPSNGTAFSIFPVYVESGGVHPVPHGAARMAYTAWNYIPAMKANIVQLISVGPSIASRGRN